MMRRMRQPINRKESSNGMGDLFVMKITKNPPGDPGGLKQLKTNYSVLIRTFAVQEGIDGADLRVVVLVGLHLVITIEVFDVGDRVVQL